MAAATPIGGHRHGLHVAGTHDPLGVQEPPRDEGRVRDQPVALEAQRMCSTQCVLPVGVAEIAVESRVAEGPDGRERGVVELGRMTNLDVLHAMS